MSAAALLLQVCSMAHESSMCHLIVIHRHHVMENRMKWFVGRPSATLRWPITTVINKYIRRYGWYVKHLKVNHVPEPLARDFEVYLYCTRFCREACGCSIQFATLCRHTTDMTGENQTK